MSGGRLLDIRDFEWNAPPSIALPAKTASATLHGVKKVGRVQPAQRALAVTARKHQRDAENPHLAPAVRRRREQGGMGDGRGSLADIANECGAM